MDLSVFLILIVVAFQFVAEYFGWNQYKVKLGIFITTLVITLPSIVFMVIDWWQSPHSKIALLALNTFNPILRGETYRLFRWLKSVGIGLTSDELNFLPMSKFNADVFEFYMTKECFDLTRAKEFDCEFQVIVDDVADLVLGSRFYIYYTKCTGFVCIYANGILVVHQFRFSRKLLEIYFEVSAYEEFIGHPLFKSSLMRSPASYAVDLPTAKLLFKRLERIVYGEMPIVTRHKHKREWHYFHAASTLDNLDGDLVLIQSRGEYIAVG